MENGQSAFSPAMKTHLALTLDRRERESLFIFSASSIEVGSSFRY